MNQPSVIAVQKNPRQIAAVGNEAKKMIGRSPADIDVIRPLRNGQIADIEYAGFMLEQFLRDVVKRRGVYRRRIVMMICVPCNSTQIEQRAIRESGMAAGAKEVFLIEEPLAAAVGAGLDIARTEGNMVVDIGGGTTDIAIISYNAIVTSNSIRVAGDAFDQAIMSYIRQTFSVQIGESTAESIKMKIGTVIDKDPLTKLQIRARNIATSLPTQFTLDSNDIKKALDNSVTSIINAIRETMDQSPSELASDIAAVGMVITGGGALIDGLPQLISDQTGLHVIKADDPLKCVSVGCAQTIKELETAKQRKMLF